MKAVLVATGRCPAISPLDERYASLLLPLVDRPFLQHVVEYLVARGVREMDVLLNEIPEKVRDLLGDGTRWGCTLRYHLVRDPLKPYGILRSICGEADAGQPLLLAHADKLPALPGEGFPEDTPGTGRICYCLASEDVPEGDGGTWTGWALLSHGVATTLPADADEKELADHLLAGGESGAKVLPVQAMLSMRTFEDIRTSQAKALAGHIPGLMLSGREVDPGIWLSRNVNLHPLAQITPPVFIGEDCTIGQGVRLGPDVAVGRGCILDKDSSVQKTVVFPRSYVGEGLDLDEAIVDRNLLINMRIGTAVTVTDNFILSDMELRGIRNTLRQVVSRIAGLGLLLLLWPVLLLTILGLKLTGSSRKLVRQEVLKLPASWDASTWQTFGMYRFARDGEAPGIAGPRKGTGLMDFLFCFIPALINVVRGELHVVGTAPRTRPEAETLTRDWKELLLKSRTGIVNEAHLNFGPEPTEDELFSAEVVYSATASLRNDARLFFRYLGRAVREL